MSKEPPYIQEFKAIGKQYLEYQWYLNRTSHQNNYNSPEEESKILLNQLFREQDQVLKKNIDKVTTSVTNATASALHQKNFSDIIK